VQRVMGPDRRRRLRRAIGEIQRLERMLCDEGVLLLKYWFHLSKPQQKKRLQSLAADPARRAGA
jgi:polyphosphate kinase 2 (PPK2 family)